MKSISWTDLPFTSAVLNSQFFAKEHSEKLQSVYKIKTQELTGQMDIILIQYGL